LAASASRGGSNQVFTQMILILMLGLTVWAPSIVELSPAITSGMGNDETYPSTPVFDIFAAMTPWV